MPQLSIVIPAYNEADNLGPLIAEIVEVFAAQPPQPDYEIIVVDDGSTDATRRAMRDAMADVPQLRLLTHARRAGKSAALITGFEAARGAWIAMLDGDGQNDPADLARLWPEIAAGATDTIYAGVRRRRNDGAVKWATSKLANRVRQFMLRDGCRDTGCGFKVIPRNLARALPYFDNMHRFLPALARREGLAMREVTINDRARRHGVSKYGFFDRAAVAFLDLMGMYWLMRRYSPRGEILEVEAEQPAPEHSAAGAQGVR